MDWLIEKLKERLKDSDRYVDAAKQIRLAEKLLGKGKYGYNSEIPPPATLKQIEAAENELGFALPKLLRDIYIQVANGGFGPGYGLLGLPPNGTTDDQGYNAVTLSLGVINPDNPDDFEGCAWPEGFLPICYYGCNIYACLDCAEEEGPIVLWEAGFLSAFPEAESLKVWLKDWVSK